MKKILLSLAIFPVCVLLHAQTIILAGNPAIVNNATSNFTATAAFSYNPSLKQYVVTHNALGNTNDLAVNVQATLDQTNYVTLGVWHPSNTNAATETIYAGTYSVSAYTRPQVTTTNSQSFYIGYGP